MILYDNIAQSKKEGEEIFVQNVKRRKGAFGYE